MLTENSTEIATKGNRGGLKISVLVKKTAFLITLLLFIVSGILVLDAYKFIYIRHAKFARKKLLTTLQYMDPNLIESHSGFKVLSVEEHGRLTEELSAVRSQIREANNELQEKLSDVFMASDVLKKVQKDGEDLKHLIENAGGKS
jgi:hypothetical protein